VGDFLPLEAALDMEDAVVDFEDHIGLKKHAVPGDHRPYHNDHVICPDESCHPLYDDTVVHYPVLSGNDHPFFGRHCGENSTIAVETIAGLPRATTREEERKV